MAKKKPANPKKPKPATKSTVQIAEAVAPLFVVYTPDDRENVRLVFDSSHSDIERARLAAERLVRTVAVRSFIIQGVREFIRADDD